MKDMKDDETILVGELWGALNTMRDVHRDAMWDAAPDEFVSHEAQVYGALELLRAAGVISEATDERLSKEWERMCAEEKARREEERRLSELISMHLDPKDLWGDTPIAREFCRGCPNDGLDDDGAQACGIEPWDPACPRREEWRRIEIWWGRAGGATVDVLMSHRAEAAP